MKLRRSANVKTADTIGIESLFHLLRRHSSVGRSGAQAGDVLLAACRTFRHLAAHQSVTSHAETSDLVKELDVRRDRLPSSNRPSEFTATATINAYEDAFEAGYRAWPKINPYDRADCRRAWELGYANGGSAFEDQLEQRRFSVAYSSGFFSGHEGVGKSNPYCKTTLKRAADETRAVNDWRRGFEAGTKAAAVA